MSNYLIIYVLDYSPSAKQAIQDAIAKVEHISCIRFVQRTSEPYYIRFIRSSG